MFNKTIRPIGLAAVVLVGLGAGCIAAAHAAGGHNWTGFYVGANVGGLFGSTDYSFPTSGGAAPSGSSSNDGVVGGIYGGYQYEFMPMPFVLGIEGDFQGSSASGSFKNFSNATSQGSTDLHWQSSIRGRVGYAMDRLLPYVTGGVEFGEFHFGGGPAFTSATPICCGFSKTLTGWTIGGGLDYALTNAIILQVEYRYEDFGSVTNGLPPTFPGVPMTVSPTANMITIGVDWQF